MTKTALPHVGAELARLFQHGWAEERVGGLEDFPGEGEGLV